MDNLQLIAGERATELAKAVRWNHETILQECDAPGEQNHPNQRFVIEKAEFQMPIPRESHEDIGTNKEQDGFHG